MNSFRQIAVLGTVTVAALLTSVTSHAAPFTVDAAANSTSGGTGAATISLMAGQAFTVTVGVTDLWNAGALPRWSNADGLVGDVFATGADESGQPLGTQISQNWGTYTQGGLTAAYGTLVGSFDNGASFFSIGTSYSGIAAAGGLLNLYYFDSVGGDNTGSVLANVTAVPEPGALVMGLAGLAVLVSLGSRRRG